jgi:cell division protein ZapA
MKEDKEKKIITFKIADRSQKTTVLSPAEIPNVRLAADMINAKIAEYRNQGHDMTDALMMVAFDSLVARLKGDDQIAEFQRVVFKNIEHIREIMSPSELAK